MSEQEPHQQREEDRKRSSQDHKGKPRRDEGRKPRHSSDGKPRRDDDRKPRRDDAGKPRREGEWKPRRDDAGKARRDGESKPRREGEWKPRRDDDRKPRGDDAGKSRSEGEWKSRRDSDRKPRREGEWKPSRDGEFKPRRDDDRKPRSGDRDDQGRGGTRGGGRSDRGGSGREFTEAERLQHSLRPVRDRHFDPEIPEEVQQVDLHPGARNELKTLDKELAEIVARHLVMVGNLIDDDPKLAHQHAISAMRKAGRIPVARETYAVTSYVTGDYATALRELRTYRRLSGSELQLALMIDSERALGRPEKALETGRSVDSSKLPTDVRVQVAIAMSGARLDLGQTLQALYELEIPELDPNRAYPWSPELFAAYAIVLEDLGREREAIAWRKRAFAAEEALNTEEFGEMLEVYEIGEEQAHELHIDKPKPNVGQVEDPTATEVDEQSASTSEEPSPGSES